MLRRDRAVIDAARGAPQPIAVRAEAAAEFVSGKSRQIADRLDTELRQLARRHLADAPQPADGQRRQERGLLAGRHDGDAVRLPVVTGDLGDQFVGRDAQRGRQPQLALDPILQGLRQLAGRAIVRLGAADIEEGLVDGDRLDQRGVIAEDAP